MRTRLLSVGTALPAHRHDQGEITDTFARVVGTRGAVSERLLRSIHGNAGVAQRHLALPLHRYETLAGVDEANDLFLEHAVALGATALQDALKAAGLTPTDVDLIVSTTVTGLAVPSLDARSGCARTSSGSRSSAWAASPARPASRVCTTTSSATPTTSPSSWPSSSAP